MKNSVRDERILNVLRGYKKLLEVEKGLKIQAIALKGSQNYNLDDEDSDFDAVAVVIPTIENLVKKESIIDKILTKNGEITVYDIVSFANICKKGSPIALELIFTPHKIGILDFVEKFKIKPRAYLGIAEEKLHALTKHYPSRMEYINKYGFDPKQLHHLIRMANVVSFWVKTGLKVPYLYYESESAKQELIDLKRRAIWNGKVLTVEQAIKLGNQFINDIRLNMETMDTSFELNDIDYTEITNIINNANGFGGFLRGKVKDLDNGRQVLEMKDSVNFLIITSDKYLVIGEQKRAGSHDKDLSLGLFGGYIDGDEHPITSMYREMWEETNMRITDVDRVYNVYNQKFVSEGYSTEKNSLYLVYMKKPLAELDFMCNDDEENIFHAKFLLDELNREENKKEVLDKISGLRGVFALYVLMNELKKESK